jgi:YYY domain-containing protein
MIPFFLWYLLVSALGWLTFPLAFRLLPALADRGFIFSRTIGLLIWGYVFWLLASLGIAQNDAGGMLLALALLLALCIWSFNTYKEEILSFIKSNSWLVITTEILFLTTFALMAFIRSANSELFSTEKPMELAFISGIMRSPTFPPQDPWLSGYAISYYYFGYVITAMLATLTNLPASMAHNLMTSLIFSLAAVGAYGFVYTLLVKTHKQETAEHKARYSSVGLSLLAPLFLLLVSNFGALLEVLYRYGIFWKKDAAGQFVSPFWAWLKSIDKSHLIWNPNVTTYNFWTWLGVKELNMPPAEPLGWQGERYLWWWRSSRLLQDYDMLNRPQEVIDEFPFFSFLLGDLHPHVLAIPFTLLAIAVALNLFLGGWKGEINLFGTRLDLKPEGFLFSALVLGGLAFLNTWDILIGATLIVAAYVFTQAREKGWNWHLLEDLLLLGLPLGIVSILLYMPFYFGFSSQAGGLLPSLMYPTRGAHLWLMWGTLLIPIFCLLIYKMREGSFTLDGELSEYGIKPNWKIGLWLGLGFVLFLFILMWVIGVLAYYFEPDEVARFLSDQTMDIPTLFRETSLRRLSYIGGLITMLAVLIPSLAFLFGSSSQDAMISDGDPVYDGPWTAGHRSQSVIVFVMLLITIGSVLIIAPDFVYLRDQFGYRINTIFKFYYQAWVLWSLVAAFGVAYLMQNIKSLAWNIIFRVGIGLVIFAGLLYPALSIPTKTNDFEPYGGFSLDDFDRIKRENPDDAAGIEFLRNAPDGIVVEAIGGSYDASFARIATYTGLQNVLGWPGHESQWRGGGEPQGTRQEDVKTLYTTPDWETARLILEKYNIRYVYIGNTERIHMELREEKFIENLKLVFQQGNVSIYEVP